MTQLQLGFATGGTGSNDQFALQKSRTADVRFGSKADIAASPTNAPQQSNAALRTGVV
jgi:hypothetical protein